MWVWEVQETNRKRREKKKKKKLEIQMISNRKIRETKNEYKKKRMRK